MFAQYNDICVKLRFCFRSLAYISSVLLYNVERWQEQSVIFFLSLVKDN